MTRDELREYKKLQKQFNELKKQMEEMKHNFIGEANETGVYSYDWSDMGYKVSTYDHKSIDMKALEKDLPDVYAKYLRITPVQQFRTH